MLIADINDAIFNAINLSYFNLLQTDLEEEKAQEIAKLQEALHAMQIQVEEANTKVIKEREAAIVFSESTPEGPGKCDSWVFSG